MNRRNFLASRGPWLPVVETIMCHTRCGHATAERRALELMELVAIPSARNRLASFAEPGHLVECVRVAHFPTCKGTLHD
ncbi:hypothetical protein [Cupriavidus sp. DF5525]|uniref:hypothetical protein n=1 Tax=Cupriavidus sp. DF5525 TaxID=3160989 RepID=UPI0032DEC335